MRLLLLLAVSTTTTFAQYGVTPLFAINGKTSTYQVLESDFAACKTITVASGTFTITLVASSDQPTLGRCITVLNYGTGTITLARSGQNINGAASNLTGAAGSATAPTGWRVYSDGTNYFAEVIGGGGGSGAVSSVTAGPSGAITVSPTTGPAVVDVDTAYVPSKTGTNNWTGPNDFSGASLTKPLRTLTSDPATCSVGEQIFRSDTGESKTCVSTNKWAIDGSADNPSVFEISDEFCGSITDHYALGWTRVGTAGNDTSQNLASFDHPCVGNAYTSGVNNVAGYSLRFDGTAGGANWGVMDGWASKTNIRAMFIFRVGGLTQVKYRAGFSDSITEVAPANGIYAEFSSNTSCTTNGSDTQWKFHTRTSSTSSPATGATVNTNTWVRLLIFSTTAGTWMFSTSENGGAYSAPQSLSSNVPTGRLAPFFSTVSCAGGTYYVFVDKFYQRATGLTR